MARKLLGTAPSGTTDAATKGYVDTAVAGVSGGFSVAAPTGTVSTDQAAIQTKVNAAASAGGGVVVLQPGIYAVTSANRTDAGVSYTGSLTWTDTHVVSGDVGSYVIGANINGRAPKIVSVTAGTSFVTDIAPGGTVSSASMIITKPGIDLPDGVTIQGAGAATGNVTSGVMTGGTTVFDNGTGCTVFQRGGNNEAAYFSRGGVVGMTIQGASTYGSIGSTFAGIWINNNASYFKIWDCEITGHLTWGLGLDYNINSLDCRNTGFTYSGNSTSTSPTGGVGVSVFNGFASAAVNLYNCWGYHLYGFFVTPVNGQASMVIQSCQWNVILTSNSYLSGSGICVTGPNSVLIDCWSETCQGYDVIVGYAFCSVIGGNFIGGGTGAFQMAGSNSILNLQGVATGNHSVCVTLGSGIVSWTNCNVGEATFISGVATPAQAAGVGSTAGMTGPGGAMASQAYVNATAGGGLYLDTDNMYELASAGSGPIVSGSVNGTATALILWTGTAAQYAAIGSKNSSTIYCVTP